MEKFSIILVFLMCFTCPVKGGSGATHAMLGAVGAKYLTSTRNATYDKKFSTISSALLLGVASHFVSDHYGNFEPHNGSWQMSYFILEGLIGGLLLIPQWKKDTRLFWGSIGGMIPDLEHSVQPFKKRISPVHNGLIPHGRRKHFFQGVIENIMINSISYYLIIKNNTKIYSNLSPMFGVRINLWNGEELSRNSIRRALLKTASPVSVELVLRIPINQTLLIETSASTWMKRLANPYDKEIPPRRVVQSFITVVTLNPKAQNIISPYIGLGIGLFVWGDSNPVNYGDISFVEFNNSQFRIVSCLGIDLHINKNTCIVLSVRYNPEYSRLSRTAGINIPELQPGISVFRSL